MMRRRHGKLAAGIALALMVTVGSATAQTKCRGYKTTVVFGDVCAWGCGGNIECNCVVGACADGTVVVL